MSRMALRVLWTKGLSASCSRRMWNANSRFLSTTPNFKSKPEYSVTFIRPDGEKVTGKGKEGDSLLDVVVNCDLDFDGYGDGRLLRDAPEDSRFPRHIPQEPPSARHVNEINLPCACEGTLTCSTCHVILKPEDYEKLPDKPSEEENDMLDLAYGLTDTSRLGCQILLSKKLDGLEVSLPATVNDARS